MDLKQIEALIQLLSENDVREFQYKDDDTEFKLRLGQEVATVVAPQVVAAPTAAAPAAAPAAAAAPAQQEQSSSNDGLVTIDAPMVGTFYRSPNPDSPAFVEPGQRIQKGAVLCIVEAMKLMNEIESEIAGEVVEVLVENAQPVQFGQPLFRIRPA